MSKVIWVINQTAGKDDSGWGERHLNMARHWVQAGYQVAIISGSYNHLFINQPITGNKRFTLEEVEPGISFCWVKIPRYDGASVFKLWSMMVFALKTLFLKASLLGRPDHIIVSSMPIFPIISGWYLKRKYKACSLSFEIRDLWPLSPIHLSGYSKWHPVILFMRWIERFGYRKADHIVSLLPNANRYIDPISGDPTKYHWISNGIKPDPSQQEEIPSEIKAQLPTDRKIIAYTGTLGMANALEFLVEASIALRDDDRFFFLLVGDGYLKPSFLQQTEGNANILFLDKLPKQQIQPLLKHVDIGFIGRSDTPLFDYGVASNKYFDYMLAGIPILESSNPIDSPAQRAECSLTVQPGSARAIVEGLKTLASTCSKDLEKMGERGKDYVIKHHNFKGLSKKYLNLFGK